MSETLGDASIAAIGQQMNTAINSLEIHAVKVAIGHIDTALELIQVAGMDEAAIEDLDTAARHGVLAENYQDKATREIGIYICALGLTSLYTGTAHVQRQIAEPIPLPPPARFKAIAEELANKRLARQEEILTGTFTGTVETLDIAKLAVVPEGRKTPRTLGNFRLIPLMRRPGELYDESSLSHTAYAYDVPEDIRTTYRPDRGKPYLDTQCAIGLVYSDWLVAVAGAGLTKDGDLKIIHLQDVSGPAGKPSPTDPKARYKTGLHDGILWRDTLVAAWAEVARQTGVAETIVIQSASNNPYDTVRQKVTLPDGSVQPQGYAGYDKVAGRMHFTQDNLNGDWVKPVRNIYRKAS